MQHNLSLQSSSASSEKSCVEKDICSSSRWSVHFGVLQQVCSLEQRNQFYNIDACVAASRKAQRTLRHTKSSDFGRKQTVIVNQRRNTIADLYTIKEVLDKVDLSKKIEIKHDENNNTSEILTPFQAVAGLKRSAPAYWVNMSYIYHPMSRSINVTIRQTGVLPDAISRLSMEIKLSFGKSRNQTKTVVLKTSTKDNSFKSSKVSFKVDNELDIRNAVADIGLCTNKMFSKQKISEWQLSLADCSHIMPKLQFQKVDFSK